MASDRSKAIWELSVPLAQFLIEQAHQRITAEPFSLEGFGWRLLELVNRTTEAFIAPGNMIEQTKRALGRGTLVATGIRILPSPSRTPVLIAPTMIARARIRSLENALVGDGFRYLDVRVIRRRDIPASIGSSRPRQNKRRLEISRAIAALHKSGQLTGLRKQQVFVVRETLEKAGVENLGTDKTIERLIRHATKSEKRK